MADQRPSHEDDQDRLECVFVTDSEENEECQAEKTSDATQSMT
jgi:hypothetical protein